VPTNEDSRTEPISVYGATKLAQEQIAACFGAAFGVPVAILRYQNVYGAGQSLANSYTGILTHFFSALRRGEAPRVFEDGLESRDFVNVEDAVDATLRALDARVCGVFNVGSGVATTVLAIAEAMCQLVAPDLKPLVVPEYRAGDIRHCVADLHRAMTHLGYRPCVTLDDGLRQFIAWATHEPDRGASASTANRELVRYGLLGSADTP
jgi:dTDP-L-rhamnose 4-epimerase